MYAPIPYGEIDIVHALHTYAWCVYTWVQQHVWLAWTVACICVWTMYCTYRTHCKNEIVWAWQRPVYIPRSYDTLCNHFSMDFNNMWAVLKEMWSTFSILVCYTSVFISCLAVGIGFIIFTSVTGIVSLTLFNPAFWIAIVVIKVLIFM